MSRLRRASPGDAVPPEGRRREDVVEKYRESLKDEEPVVTEGLSCAACGRVYPIVSDIPVMLVEEALPADARMA